MVKKRSGELPPLLPSVAEHLPSEGRERGPAVEIVIVAELVAHGEGKETPEVETEEGGGARRAGKCPPGQGT